MRSLRMGRKKRQTSPETSQAPSRPTKQPVCQTVWYHLEQLHEDPVNARSHDAVNLAAIRASLLEFGQVEPLVVRRGTNTVIGGNARLQVMRDLGWTEAAVVEVDLSDVKAVALGIALNQTAALATWNEETLGRLLEAVRGSDEVDLSVTGFSAADAQRLIEAATSPEAEKDDDDQEPPDDKYTEQYGVIVLCKDEADQQQVYEKLLAQGLAVKVVAT